MSGNLFVAVEPRERVNGQVGHVLGNGYSGKERPVLTNQLGCGEDAALLFLLDSGPLVRVAVEERDLDDEQDERQPGEHTRLQLASLTSEERVEAQPHRREQEEDDEVRVPRSGRRLDAERGPPQRCQREKCGRAGGHGDRERVTLVVRHEAQDEEPRQEYEEHRRDRGQTGESVDRRPQSSPHHRRHLLYGGAKRFARGGTRIVAPDREPHDVHQRGDDGDRQRGPPTAAQQCVECDDNNHRDAGARAHQGGDEQRDDDCVPRYEATTHGQQQQRAQPEADRRDERHLERGDQVLPPHAEYRDGHAQKRRGPCRDVAAHHDAPEEMHGHEMRDEQHREIRARTSARRTQRREQRHTTIGNVTQCSLCGSKRFSPPPVRPRPTRKAHSSRSNH